MGRVRKVLTGPWVIAVLVVAVGGVGFGLYWFQPWKLWQDETVEEALPAAVVTQLPPRSVPRRPRTSPPRHPAPAPGPQMLASGELISHEHATSGTVKLVRLADGSHVVRLENLDTSNGPDLRVWLTDAPVKRGTGRLARLRRRRVRQPRQAQGQQGKPELRPAPRRGSVALHAA